MAIRKLWEKIDQYVWGIVAFFLGYMFRGIVGWLVQLPIVGRFFEF